MGSKAIRNHLLSRLIWGRHPSLLLLSVELPINGAPDPLMGAFLADLANPEQEEREFLSAA